MSKGLATSTTIWSGSIVDPNE